MAVNETESMGSETGTPEESKAQQQARLRRERRNAKIQAGGSERLSKITQMSGRAVAAEAELEKARSRSPKPPVPSQPDSAHADDPAEMDISSLNQKPHGQNGVSTQEDMLRQLLRGPGGAPGQDGSQQPQTDDPMMRMMQQMLGGAGSENSSQGPDPSTQAFAELFGAATSQKEPTLNNHDNLWRVIHALCAFTLAFYALFTYNVVGSKLARAESQLQDPRSPPLFWLFTTVELVLQSSRYFLEGGRPPPSGLLATAGQILPEPYGNYLRILSRYRIIYNTIISDALIIIFVLGCAAWWKGLAAS